MRRQEKHHELSRMLGLCHWSGKQLLQSGKVLHWMRHWGCTGAASMPRFVEGHFCWLKKKQAWQWSYQQSDVFEGMIQEPKRCIVVVFLYNRV